MVGGFCGLTETWKKAIEELSSDNIKRHALIEAGEINAAQKKYDPKETVNQFEQLLMNNTHYVTNQKWKYNNRGEYTRTRKAYANFCEPCLVKRHWPESLLTGPPDFVGVGSQRCGTTKAFYLIANHPDVYTPVNFADHLGRDVSIGIKERHFFERFAIRDWDDKYIEMYHDIFPRPKGQITGEWTACIMHSWYQLPLLKKCAPAAKIIVSLRDPIERYKSGMAYVEKRMMNWAMVASDAFQRGFYFMQISHLLQYYKRENIHFIQFEKMIQDPQKTANNLYDFLGLERFRPNKLNAQMNESRCEKRDLGYAHSTLKDFYRHDVANLQLLFKAMEIDFDFSLWKNFGVIT